MVEPEPDPVAVAKRIGREYVETDRLPYEDTIRTGSIYHRLAETVSQLYDEIPVPVEYQADDPYDDYLDMSETVDSEGVLRIYNQHTDHPHFTREQQLQFRAVHDWHGHLKHAVDFSPTGEWLKWNGMREHFSPDENAVMFAEVVGQVGAVHYLQNGFADDRYQQRAFVAPVRWMRWMREAVQG